jgi:hypothetical protein
MNRWPDETGRLTDIKLCSMPGASNKGLTNQAGIILSLW